VKTRTPTSIKRVADPREPSRQQRTPETRDLELSLDLFNVLTFIDRDRGLYKQVSEFEEGPR
jgi:hypothetical protein